MKKNKKNMKIWGIGENEGMKEDGRGREGERNIGMLISFGAKCLNPRDS